MGKAVIILIVGLSVIIGIAATSIIGRTSEAQKSAVSAFNRTGAKNVATSAAEYYFLQLKATPTLRGTFSVPSILNGSARETISDWTVGSTDSIRLTSIGTYDATSETVTVKIRQVSPPLALNSATNYLTPALTWKNSAQITIDGHDHDINNNLLPPGSNDRSAVSATNASDSTTMANANKCTKSGTSTVIVDGSIPDPAALAAGLISKASITFTGGSYSGTRTWGSAGAPVVVYINGNAQFSGPITGYGILLVNGTSIAFSAPLTFTGLVLMYNSAALTWKSSQVITIVGGFVLSSPAKVTHDNSQLCYFNYSKAGINLANTLLGGGSGALTVANWSE